MDGRGTARAGKAFGVASAWALLAILAAGCGRGGGGGEPAGARAAARVVCGSPAVTEIVFALGCGGRVVGVSDFADYPREAAEKPCIGGWFNPNRERLLVLKPDMIVTQGRHEGLRKFALLYGVRFHAVKLDTLADVFEAIRTISEALGVPDRGRELAGEVRRGLDATRERVSGRPRQRVLAVVGRTPGDLGGLATVGPRSVLGDLLAVAGGSNLFADAAGPYPQISKESILVRKPDVILELSPGPLPDGTLRMLREDWSRLPGIPAVEAGRIHYLTNSYLLIPGPRVADAAARLAEAMHPRGGVAP